MRRYAENKEEIKEYFKQYNQKNKVKNKNRTIQRLYGLDLIQYNKMLEQQEFKCGACKQEFKDEKSIHIDHDHSCCSGHQTCGTCIRGILCSGCNRALGFLNDDPEKIIKLFDYITDYNKK